MSDDFSDETKSFRKTDTESNIQDDFESEISSEKRDATGAVESTSTAAPFASPFFGASLTPGLAGLPPFASPVFSPYYSTYNSANLMMAALAMSPQYQVAQNMLLSAMSSQMNSPTVSQPAYPNAAESSASCPSTPKSSMKTMKEPRELYKDRIKKPLNSFMIYKKEMRPILIQDPEFANKHSADINAILGQRWHKLSEEEQQVYYEKARIEKEEHEKKYPGWSARDNYSFKSKRNPRKFQINEDTNDQIDAKRCRALYGIENQAKWCRHCKVKKRCLLVGGSDGDDLPDVSTAPINNEQTVTPAPIMPQPVPMHVNPMMSPFRMPFSMYPFGFPPFPGISPNFGNTVQSFGQSKHETES